MALQSDTPVQVGRFSEKFLKNLRKYAKKRQKSFIKTMKEGVTFVKKDVKDTKTLATLWQIQC